MQRFPDVDLKDLPYAKFILEQVKRIAKKEKGFWVCCTIGHACSNSKVLKNEGEKLVLRIESALAPSAWVTHWAYERGQGQMTPSERDAYRREWIDHMLKEPENDESVCSLESAGCNLHLPPWRE